MTASPVTDRTPRALLFGEVLFDCFEDREVPGGAPFNVAVHLARAGWDVSMLTRIGEDRRGEALARLFEEEGVSAEHLQRDPEAPTGTVTVAVGGGGEPTFTIHEDVAWDRVALPGELDDPDVLYFGTLAARASTSRATLEALQARSIPWKVFDVNLRQTYWGPEVLDRGLSAADLVKLNRDELETLAGALDLDADPAAFLDRYRNLAYLCLTLGAEGAALHRPGAEPVRVPARPMEADVGPGPTQPALARCSAGDSRPPGERVVDTVGAGDALCAGMVRALVEGEEPAAALEQGARLAARVCAHRGAIPPRE